MLWHTFNGQGLQQIANLPEMHESLIVLISISHGGYLASKAVPHSKTGVAERGANPAAATEHEPAMG
jgi:hypothetical protein